MCRSKCLMAGAALAAIVMACGKGNSNLPSPIGPSWPSASSGVGGVVTEPVGVPVPGVRVTITDGPFKARATFSEPDGRYAIARVDGEFTLSFEKSGYVSTTRRVNLQQNVEANAEMAPLAPQPDVSGSWTARFAPFKGCGQFMFAEPIAEIAFVEYQASIVQRGARLDVSLSGGGLPAPALVEGSIQGSNVLLTLPAGCADYYSTCNPADAQPPTVVSRLPDGRYLSVSGLVSATLRNTSIVGSMNGIFTLWSAPKPPWESLGTCQHDQHQVTFTR